MNNLSEFQQKRKAENIVDRLALQEDLSNLKGKLNDLFKDSDITVADSISSKELEELIVEIKKGTATNNKIARFLELASQIGI
ncbi:MAG TPA: hypothetical protein VK957_04595 [Lunatimonas sp.]|nr:hypothetical protein [Lunatimonas sp.]